MALSQTWVYSYFSISNIFELLETTRINTWLLLFATELRLHYWHCSRDEPCSVFSYVHHALPVLWLTLKAPASSGLLSVLLELLLCTLKYTTGAPSLIHLPDFVNAPQKLTYMNFLPQKTPIICNFFFFFPIFCKNQIQFALRRHIYDKSLGTMSQTFPVSESTISSQLRKFC